jgi:hypothetical protein
VLTTPSILPNRESGPQNQPRAKVAVLVTTGFMVSIKGKLALPFISVTSSSLSLSLLLARITAGMAIRAITTSNIIDIFIIIFINSLHADNLDSIQGASQNTLTTGAAGKRLGHRREARFFLLDQVRGTDLDQPTNATPIAFGRSAQAVVQQGCLPGHVHHFSHPQFDKPTALTFRTSGRELQVTFGRKPLGKSAGHPSFSCLLTTHRAGNLIVIIRDSPERLEFFTAFPALVFIYRHILILSPYILDKV